MGCGASSEAPPKKTFVFRLKVIGGLNLYNNGFGLQIPGTKTSTFNFNGKSDPYCKVICEGRHEKTETVLHEQNPVWNQEFYFPVDNCNPTVEFRVFDADVVSSDDCIGTAKVDLTGMIGRDKEREYWVPLEGSRSNGEIGFTVVECYRMEVLAKNGTDVAAKDALSGTSDCYLTIDVGQQPRQKSVTKGWTLNPIWNQKFNFFVPYGVESQLQMILWDHDSLKPDENMGWAYVTMHGKPEHGKPRDLQLKISHASGLLNVTLTDDTTIETTPGPAQVTPELKKKFPPSAPQTATFQCCVLGAYNLAAADHNYAADFANAVNSEFFHEFKENTGTSDPFARVTVEGQVYDTHHINNTLEPNWNTRMRFIARDKETSVLKVDLFDHDIVMNDSIGAVTLPLNMLKPGERTEMWSFLDRGRGEVGLELSMDYLVKVRVVSCSDLPAKDLNGMCDPYVKLKIGGTEYKTRIVRDNRSPWYEEDFRFALPTLANQKLSIEVWDADFTLFKKSLSEDLCGLAEYDLKDLANGIPNELTIPLAAGGKPQGEIRLVITNEIPVPQSALDLLEQKGKEAFNNAVAKLTATADVIKTLKLPDFDKKEEGEIQVYDSKIDQRPRFSRVSVEVVAARGLPLSAAQIHFGVSLPLQGQRYKTKEYSNSKNPDVGEVFEFKVPSKISGGMKFTVYDSSKQSYTSWVEKGELNVYLPFDKFYGDGIIRGAEADDFWVPFPEGGEICIRAFEMYRYNVRIESAKGLKTDTDPYVQVILGNNEYNLNTHTVPMDPAKDRSEGVKGEPRWNEQYTFFSKTKKGLELALHVKDETMFGSDNHLGRADFKMDSLRRGIPQTVTLPLDKGGEITITVKEEEKMHLIDRVIDQAKNAQKLAAAAASEAADKIANAAGNAASAVTGALGGLFGK